MPRNRGYERHPGCGGPVRSVRLGRAQSTDWPRFAFYGVGENYEAAWEVALSSHAELRDEEFRDFVLGCQSRVLRVAELLTGDRGHAEDLAHHGFGKAYASWERIRTGNPESYVRRCIVNAHTDRWRRGSWRERTDASLNDRPQVDDPTELYAERDNVWRALARLTPSERGVLTLRYYSGLTEAEIGSELGMPVGTVKSTAARAIRRLRMDTELRPGTETDSREGVIP